MQIKNAIKICCNKIPRGIVIPTDELGYWNINVVFWNASDKRDDETQFDIIPANFDYGIGKCTELEELWKDFCKENGIELIVLIEELGMRNLEDVLRWRNPRLRRYKKVKWMHQQGKWSGVPLRGKPPTSNETLYKIMKSFGEHHSVKWEFCDPKDAGAKVIEILTRGKR